MPASPKTRAFIEPLPLPQILSQTPREQFSNPSRAVPSTAAYYQLEMRQAMHSFHRDLPLNSIWGYNGLTLGPTIVAQANSNGCRAFPQRAAGQRSRAHRHADLLHPPARRIPSADDDGHPANFFPIGASRDYVFLNPAEDSNLCITITRST